MTGGGRSWGRGRGLAVLLAGTVLGAPGAGAQPEPPPPPAATRFVGIDGVDPFETAARDADLLAVLTGVKSALVRTVPVAWGRVEPRPPVLNGRHLRDWEDLDAFLSGWTGAGFEVVPVLSPASGWASVPLEETAYARAVRASLPPGEADVLVSQSTGAGPPREQRWDDWERFVLDLVERYDGDGRDDASGLGRGVRWIQVVGHPTAPEDWTGSAEEYTRLLHHATQAAAKAHPAVQVIHGAVDFGTQGREPWPDDAELRKRVLALRTTPQAVAFQAAREVDFALLSLSLRGLFGAVAHVGSGHLADETVDIAYLRHRLDALVAAGQGSAVEVWLVDSPFAKLARAEVPRPSGPTDAEMQLRSRWHASARRVGGPPDGDGHLARRWWWRGQAYDAVRTICAARAAGASRVLLGGSGGPERGALDALVVSGDEGRPERTAVWYALRQASQLLFGHRTVRAERLGRTATAYRFSFGPDHTPPWLAVVVRDPDRSWAGDPRAGEALEDEVALSAPDGLVVVESPALVEGTPPRRRVRVVGGTLRLPLSPAPLYVYPER